MRIADEVEFSRVVGLIHEAGLDRTLLPEMLEALCQRGASDEGHLMIHAVDGYPIMGAGTNRREEAVRLEYEENYARNDLRVARALRSPNGKAVTEETLMTRDEIRACPIHNEFLKKLDLRHLLSVKAQLSGERFMTLSFLRSSSVGSYDQKAMNSLELVFPHARQAVRTMLALDGISERLAAASGAFDLVDFGILLLDRDGRVVDTNLVARREIRAGSSFRVTHGHVQVASPQFQFLLDEAINAISGPRLKGEMSDLIREVAFPRPDGGSPLLVTLLRLPARGDGLAVEGRATAALVFRNAAASQPPRREALALLFGFTSAECDLALALVEGLSLGECASVFGLSENTLRTRVKVLLSKTGTRRQAELVALLLKTLPQIQHDGPQPLRPQGQT